MPFAVTLLVWMLGSHASAPPRDLVRDPDTVDFHVRAMDPVLRAWITEGATESRTLRDLLARLAASDVIVHVVVVDRLHGGVNGQLSFVTATRSARYLRAEITRRGNRTDTIALVAHELQHAAEVAAAPRVRDATSMATFYLAMPENVRESSRYDSTEARVTENTVRREVAGHHSAADDDLQLIAQSARPLR
jgi:hypothetical protein